MIGPKARPVRSRDYDRRSAGPRAKSMSSLTPPPKRAMVVIILILIGCLCQLNNVSTKMVVKIAYLSDEDQVHLVMNTRSDILFGVATNEHTSAQQHDVSTAIGGHMSLMEREIQSNLHGIYEE